MLEIRPIAVSRPGRMVMRQMAPSPVIFNMALAWAASPTLTLPEVMTTSAWRAASMHGPG